ncbi:hypothetical protein ACA910_008044 [Epithemia clementina (nom. ined.)]
MCSIHSDALSSDFTGPTFDQPPHGSPPTPQAWSTSLPPSVVHAETTTTTDSPLSQEAFDRVNGENARLSRELETLNEKVCMLLTVHQRREELPLPSASSVDIEQIILATTKSVLAALQQSSAPVPAVQGNGPTGPIGHDSSTRPHETDMRFESTTTPHDDI